MMARMQRREFITLLGGAAIVLARPAAGQQHFTIGLLNTGASTVFVGPAHGEFAAFQPGAATAMSYDDLKVIEAYRFLRSVAEGKPYGTTVDDAVRSATALDAMAESVSSGRWVSLSGAAAGSA